MDDADDAEDIPDLPAAVNQMLAKANTLSGNVGTTARFDWHEQTLSIVGQVGRDPSAFGPKESVEAFIGIYDDSIQNHITDECDLPVITRGT